MASSGALGTKIPRALGKYWLGAPLPEAGIVLACPKCGNHSDALGDHMVSCPRNDLRRRHDTIQGALFELAQLAGVQAALEVALPDGSGTFAFVNGMRMGRRWWMSPAGILCP